MTIDYKDSKRIVGLSTDKLPSSTYETDFSSTTGWSVESGGITYVDSIHFNHPSGVAMNTGVLYDLTTSNVSETSWTLDYDLNITTSTGVSGSSCQLFIGLSNNSTVSSSAIDTAQDYLGHFMIEAAGTHAIRKGNGSDSPEDPVGTVFSRALEADVLYCRLQRISAIKGTLSLYSDQGRTSLIESKDITITTSLAGLRYLKVILACKTTSGTHVMVGDITNMKFWNTITSGIESKPTDVQDNSILVEKDTARRYWRTPEVPSTSASTATTENDNGTNQQVMSSANFEFIGEKVVNTSSTLYGLTVNKIGFMMNKFQGSPTGTATACVMDSSANILYTFGTVDVSTLPSTYTWTYFTNTASTYTLTNGNYIGIKYSGGDASNRIGVYWDNGANYDGTNSIGSEESGGSWNDRSTQDLRFKIFTGTSTIPATWTMNPTYEDDFSSSTGWTTVGSNISITGGAITASSMTTQSENRIYKPLGFTIADDFLIQFEFEETAISHGAHYMLFTLTAGNGNINNGTNQDAIQVWVDKGSPTFYLRDKDGTSTSSNTSALTISNSTRYYVTLVNNNRTVTYTVRTGSHTGTVVGTNNITLQSGITGLTHIQSGSLSGNSGTTSYTLDNLKIYNGVTSVN